MKKTEILKVKEMPADNEQFATSGGVGSYDTVCVTSSFALVRAFAMPPPVAKLPLRWLQCAYSVVEKLPRFERVVENETVRKRSENNNKLFL